MNTQPAVFVHYIYEPHTDLIKAVFSASVAMSRNTNIMSSQPKNTVQPLYGRISPKANENLMVFAWQVGQFNGKVIKDWDAVLYSMREEGWDYSDAHIKHHWYAVIIPAIVKSRLCAVKYSKNERTNSNQGNNTFESVVDNNFNFKEDEEEYDHSLTPYARTIAAKLAEEHEDAPLLDLSAAKEEKEQEPASGGELLLLQPNAYVPPDSEKPFTRGYIGLHSEPNINTANTDVEVEANTKTNDTNATTMPDADAYTSNVATVASHDINAFNSDTTSIYESLSEASSFLDMPSEVFDKHFVNAKGQHPITADATDTTITRAAERIDSHHGDYSDSNFAMDNGKCVIKAKADKVLIKHNEASKKKAWSKSTARPLSKFATSDTRSCAAGASQHPAIVTRAGIITTGLPTADYADTGSNDALPADAGELFSSMDEEYDPEDEASASEFS